MTLLLTFVSRDAIVQASDRRLTRLDGEIAEELANKATMLCRFASFAYTGLARMGPGAGQPTDELLLDSFSDGQASLPQLVEGLRRTATSALRNTPLRGLTPAHRAVARRTSFVGAAYVGLRDPARAGRLPASDELHPMLFVVSNAQGLAAETWRPGADREFTTHYAYLPENSDFVLHVAGQALTNQERNSLNRDLRKCLVRGVGIEPLARLLARAVRGVSARNGTVGPNVMCCLVRRADVRSSSTSWGSGLVPLVELAEKAYFRKAPGDDPSMYIYSPGEPLSRIHYGPNIACGGLLIKGMLFGPQELVAPGGGPPQTP